MFDTDSAYKFIMDKFTVCVVITNHYFFFDFRVKELKKDGKSVVRGTPKIFKSSQQTSNRTPKRTPPSLLTAEMEGMQLRCQWKHLSTNFLA